jgi:hypothetical protein
MSASDHQRRSAADFCFPLDISPRCADSVTHRLSRDEARRIEANIPKLPDSPSQIRVKGVFMRRTIDSKRDAVAISDLSAVPIRCVPARAARLIGASFWGKK